jgi:AcrR family transcriptional regulator
MVHHGRHQPGEVPGRLIREARDMLKTGGLKQVNLRALAARVGITAGSVYHYYGSKAELLGLLAAGGFVELKRELERASREAEIAVRLRVWAKAYCGFAEREPALFELMFDPEVGALEAVARARAEVIAHLRQVVADVARRYRRGEQHGEAVTLAVWAAAHGAASLRASAPMQSGLIEEVICGLEALFAVPNP